VELDHRPLARKLLKTQRQISNETVIHYPANTSARRSREAGGQQGSAQQQAETKQKRSDLLKSHTVQDLLASGPQ
jgi:hypothetical protein